jgi:hypothetical protein
VKKVEVLHSRVAFVPCPQTLDKAEKAYQCSKRTSLFRTIVNYGRKKFCKIVPRWNWFTGRNYCRKMCMDMVSFESKAEEDFVVGLMRTSGVQVPEFLTVFFLRH